MIQYSLIPLNQLSISEIKLAVIHSAIHDAFNSFQKTRRSQPNPELLTTSLLLILTSPYLQPDADLNCLMTDAVLIKIKPDTDISFRFYPGERWPSGMFAVAMPMMLHSIAVNIKNVRNSRMEPEEL